MMRVWYMKSTFFSNDFQKFHLQAARNYVNFALRYKNDKFKNNYYHNLLIIFDHCGLGGYSIRERQWCFLKHTSKSQLKVEQELERPAARTISTAPLFSYVGIVLLWMQPTLPFAVLHTYVVYVCTQLYYVVRTKSYIVRAFCTLTR